MWKLELKTEESLVFVNKNNDFIIKIEARKENLVWKIYKIIKTKNDILVDDYEANTYDEVLNIISNLKKKNLSKKKILELFKLKKEQGTFFRLYRNFFSPEVEKWDIYSKNKSKYFGFVYCRYTEKTTIDINLLSEFKYIEKEILEEIQSILSIKLDIPIEINIFYFEKMKNQYKEATNYELLLDKMNFVLDDNDE